MRTSRLLAERSATWAGLNNQNPNPGLVFLGPKQNPYLNLVRFRVFFGRVWKIPISIMGAAAKHIVAQVVRHFPSTEIIIRDQSLAPTLMGRDFGLGVVTIYLGEKKKYGCS